MQQEFLGLHYKTSRRESKYSCAGDVDKRVYIVYVCERETERKVKRYRRRRWQGWRERWAYEEIFRGRPLPDKSQHAWYRVSAGIIRQAYTKIFFIYRTISTFSNIFNSQYPSCSHTFSFIPQTPHSLPSPLLSNQDLFSILTWVYCPSYIFISIFIINLLTTFHI